MEVDSFKYLSRLVSRYYKLTQIEPEYPIPWSPLSKPLDQAIFGLVTSGGIYHKGQDPPFDLEQERQLPTWGDPSFRAVPIDISPDEIGASHYHINTDHVEEDVNILLPIHRFRELSEKGQIKGQAEQAYSFMGYQGYPADLSGWREIYGPEVTRRLLADKVDCVLLTAA